MVFHLLPSCATVLPDRMTGSKFSNLQLDGNLAARNGWDLHNPADPALAVNQIGRTFSLRSSRVPSKRLHLLRAWRPHKELIVIKPTSTCGCQYRDTSHNILPNQLQIAVILGYFNNGNVTGMQLCITCMIIRLFYKMGEPQRYRESQHSEAATELREAFGVRGACSRFPSAPRPAKAPASWTHSIRFATCHARAFSSIAEFRRATGPQPNGRLSESS